MVTNKVTKESYEKRERMIILQSTYNVVWTIATYELACGDSFNRFILFGIKIVKYILQHICFYVTKLRLFLMNHVKEEFPSVWSFDTHNKLKLFSKTYMFMYQREKQLQIHKYITSFQLIVNLCKI